MRHRHGILTSTGQHRFDSERRALAIGGLAVTASMVIYVLASVVF